MRTLVLAFKKIENKDKTKFNNFYSSSKAEMIINGSDIDNLFESIYSIKHTIFYIMSTFYIISNIQKSLGKGSGWIIDSVIDHTISISKLDY